MTFSGVSANYTNFRKQKWMQTEPSQWSNGTPVHINQSQKSDFRSLGNQARPREKEKPGMRNNTNFSQ